MHQTCILISKYTMLGLLILLLVALSACGGKPPPKIPTVAVLPSPTSATSQAPTATSPPANQRATLPPTWTPQPTQVRTATPTAISILPHATASGEPTHSPQITLDPVLLQNTYWEGDGEESMWDNVMADGTIARFNIFPINLYVRSYNGWEITPEQEAAIQSAITEMNRVVPVVEVQHAVFAHITLWLMTDADFRDHAACGAYHDTVAACAVPAYAGAGLMHSTVWMDAEDPCFEETVLHELTHALGIKVHSPEEADILYYRQTCGPGRYTDRDINTLRALYNAPAYHLDNN